MSSPLDPRVRALFGASLERPEAERAAFLDDACAGDVALRRCLTGLLRAHAEAVAGCPDPTAVGEQPGEQLGRYRLRERVGEGGFGRVWLAEQEEPVRRQVALKVLKPGMDTAQVIARFEAERQALALMDHPNIAKVFDGGTTAQGRPYFVMELVRGVPITAWCEGEGAGIPARLELFLPVCHAVQHAHQKGIIHRDLKPSNVLVTVYDGRPVPKVIDFGIAKATRASLTGQATLTGYRQMLGTPEYMAPEQADPAALDVDTRADIYSLGVLLYELLTGTRPFDLETVVRGGYAEVLRTIRDVDPPRPSTRVSELGQRLAEVASRRQSNPRALCARMRGDLDWIVMRALEKDRSRRYPTAAALAEDVLRHLRHEAVAAGPPGNLYRLRKYARRHRAGVGAAGAVAVALAAGTWAGAAGYLEAQRQAEIAMTEQSAAVAARGEEQRQKDAAIAARSAEAEQRQLAEERAKQAQRAAAKAEHVLALVRRMLASSDPRTARTANYTLRQLLDDFAGCLPAEVEADAEVEATVRQLIGESYFGLGLPAAAEPHFARAASLVHAQHGEGSPAAIERDVELAACLRMAGRYAEALALLDSARARASGDDPAVQALRALALTRGANARFERRDPGDLEEAEASARAALELQRRVLPPEDGEITETLSVLGVVLAEQGRLAEAASVDEEVLTRDRERFGEDSLETATAMCNLAVVLDAQGVDRPRAESLHRQALAIRQPRLGEHLDVAQSLNCLGAVVSKTPGGRDEGIELLAKARDLRQKILGDHPSVLRAQGNLAAALLAARRPEARAAQEEAVAIARRLYGGDHVDLATTLIGLADVARSEGDHSTATQHCLDAVAMFRRLGAEAATDYAVALICAADGLQAQRQPAAAEPYAAEGSERMLASESIAYETLVRGLQVLGLARLDQGKATTAEDPLRAALQHARDQLGSDHPAVAAILGGLGEVLAAKGRFAEAAPVYREALARWRARGFHEARDAVRCRQNLADVLVRLGEVEAAAEMLQELLDLRRRDSEPRDLLARTLSDLGNVRARLGRLDDAETLHREALTVLTGIYGPVHLSVATTINNLAEALALAGKAAEAEPLYRQALAVLGELGMAESLPAATFLTNLGRCLLAQARLDEAEQACRQALAAFATADAAGHANHATCLEHLAAVCRARGDVPAGVQFLQQALAVRRGQLDAGHPEVATRQAHIAALLLHAGRHAEAEPAAREAMTIRAAREPGTWPHQSAAALLGRALAGLDRLAEAQPLLEAACREAAPPQGARDEWIAALRALIDLCERQGLAEAAQQWRERLQAATR